MGSDYPRSYSDYRYVHTWPGMVPNRGTCKHRAARRARFVARHKD